MVKIFSKIISRFYELKLIKARQKREWLETELNELPSMQEQKTNARLIRKQKSLNAKLAKPAFAACNKTEYIEEILDKKLRKFDLKQSMSYRAANHSAARMIFAATDESARTAAEQSLAEKLGRLSEKRQAYVAKLNSQKQAFLQKYPDSSDEQYKQQFAESESEYDKYSAALTEASEKYIDARSAKLRERIEKVSQQEKTLRAKVKTDVDLPEQTLLRVENLKMYFGGLKAVDDLTFDVNNGEIFGLIGPNGAGKTTVFNCITRFYNATGGNMYFRNKDDEPVDLRRFKVHDVILEGISRTFQNVELVKEISVLENLLVACTRNYRTGIFIQALGIPTVKKEDNILKSKAMKILNFMGLENYAYWPAMGLPYGILKKVEIARALMADPKLIVLDEPAAGLNNTETAQLAQLILKIRAEFGCSVLLVEHDMSLVMSICDRICAISFGKMLALGTPEEIQANKQVQEAYLGVADSEEDTPKEEQQEPKRADETAAVAQPVEETETVETEQKSEEKTAPKKSATRKPSASAKSTASKATNSKSTANKASTGKASGAKATASKTATAKPVVKKTASAAPKKEQKEKEA